MDVYIDGRKAFKSTQWFASEKHTTVQLPPGSHEIYIDIGREPGMITGPKTWVRYKCVFTEGVRGRMVAENVYTRNVRNSNILRIKEISGMRCSVIESNGNIED